MLPNLFHALALVFIAESPLPPDTQPTVRPMLTPLPPMAAPVVPGYETLPPTSLKIAASAPPVPEGQAGIADRLREGPSRCDPAPFLRLPSVERLTTCQEAGTGGCASGAATKPNQGNTWSHVFHRAARFTQPRFGLCREPIETDGLLIYEGMKLTVDPATGVYDLSFVATAPPTSVTARLQLHFARTEIPHGPGSLVEPFRLTLPPITIDPDPNEKLGDSYGLTLRVHHRGYSELFVNQWAKRSASSDLLPNFRYAIPYPAISSDWQIARTGSARFGSGLPNSDEVGR